MDLSLPAVLLTLCACVLLKSVSPVISLRRSMEAAQSVVNWSVVFNGKVAFENNVATEVLSLHGIGTVALCVPM